MPRVRTAKKLAQRIDLQYFKKLRGFRRWKLLLSIAVPLIAAGWLLAERVTSKSAVYSAGPVSSAHAVFGQNCATCHVQNAGFSAPVQDKACLACHDAPLHHANQTVTPACSSCHLEHKGKFKLASTTDAACVQCHGDLHIKEGQLKYDPHISGFDRQHPQFLRLRQGSFDPGTVNLNHHAHLQPTLRGPNGPVQMQCGDCHRPAGVNRAWPYAIATAQADHGTPATSSAINSQGSDFAPHTRSLAETGNGRYMQPIRYADQCAACHVLQFDPLISEPAPHGDTAKARAFVESSIRQLVKDHPELVRKPITTGYRDEIELTRNFLRATRDYVTMPAQPTTPENWVEQRIGMAERLLWKKDCKVCHEQTTGEPDTIPSTVKAVIPARWLMHADFDHQAHRMLSCESCHAHIADSKLTSDVNLPGIETCRRCHKEAGPMANAAEGRCYECHSYHDWQKEQPVKPKYDLKTLISKN